MVRLLLLMCLVLLGCDEAAEQKRELENKIDAEVNALVGASSAKEIARIGNKLSGAVSSDTSVRPIYRNVGDQKKVEEEIGDMPRTEVIDGVTVGFERMRKLTNDEKVDEDAYLVLWRHDDKIIGFVYRKKRRIDIDALIEETPKLMKLFSA